MGNRKAHERRGWAWVTGLALLSVVFAAPQASEAVEVATGEDVLVFVAHPDDDIILAAGVIQDQVAKGGDVTVAIMTNGDRCESQSQVDSGRCTALQPGIGTTRQGEAVNAQAELGVGESDVIFLGYPNGFIDLIRFGNEGAFPVLFHTQTYASRGLGGTDWHDYRMGPGTQHASYPSGTMEDDLLDDVVDLIDTYRPDHIFTHTFFDRHEDHRSTYLMLVDAVEVVQRDIDSAYDPYIHTSIVHVIDSNYWGAWPASANASQPVNEYPSLEADTGGELVWDQRESFVVPNTNKKNNAIYDHASQVADGGYFITRFLHYDEVFWPERLGEAEGIDDVYAVTEGGSVSDSASGVLANDVRGVQPYGLAPGIDPVFLGPMSAELVSGPAHASSFSLSSNGSFSYTHNGDESGSDSFTYRPVQGSTDGLTATVTITVNPVNDAPTAVADSYTVDRGGTRNVPAAGVLGNDTDPENDTLAAIKMSEPAHGSLTLNPNGSFVYTHDGSATTTDSFTYRANDGAANSNTVSVSLTIEDEVVEPDPLAVAISGATTGATGISYQFNSAVTGGEGTRSYGWVVTHNGAPYKSDTGSAFSFAAAASGEYRIELTVTDSTGSATDTHTLNLMGDIGTSVFVSDIIWLADAGITKGCNPPANDLYCPEDRVTRGQMAAFLVRFLGLTDIDPSIEFDDSVGSVFEDDILRLATAGITKGCNPAQGNTNFCPAGYVTRGQMAAFLVRALGFTDDGGGDLFIDDDLSIFESEIDKMATAGVTRGCNAAGDEFCPNGYVTRGQMAAFLHRADGLDS